MNSVKYDYGYMFKYSERPNTPAQRNLIDNVTESTKQRRLEEIRILPDKIIKYKSNKSFTPDQINKIKREDLIKILTESGVWPNIIQRVLIR